MTKSLTELSYFYILKPTMGRKKLLTKEDVMEAINLQLLRTGVAPTVEELRKSLRVGSTRTVLRYLKWLEDEGNIERWPGSRGLRPLKASGQGVETKLIPLVGEAPAGPLMLAEQNLEGWVRLPKDFLRPSSATYFLLRVRGDSMNRSKVQGIPIESGDLVLVKQQRMAESGDVVVALIDGEATIKRFERGQGYYVLKPESTNAKHKPIVVTREFSVLGVVSRVLKEGVKLLDV